MIYVVRHGETDWNKSGKMQGRTDIELNDTGRLQAEKVRDELSGVKFDFVFSSPLKRAVQTAEIITGSEPVTDYRLIEKGQGLLEGVDLDEIKRLKLMPSYSDEDYGVEPWSSVKERINSFFDEKSELFKGKNALIVTHGAACVRIRVRFEGEPEDGNYFSLIPPNCKCLVYSSNQYI